MTSCSNITNLTSLIDFFNCTLAKYVLPFLVTLSVVAFVYGILQYFLNPDNEEKRKAGKSYMLWGVIALFVMIAFWGFVGILSDTFVGGRSLKVPAFPL